MVPECDHMTRSDILIHLLLSVQRLEFRSRYATVVFHHMSDELYRATYNGVTLTVYAAVIYSTLMPHAAYLRSLFCDDFLHSVIFLRLFLQRVSYSEIQTKYSF